MLLLGITHGLIRVSSLDAGPQSARVRAEEVRTGKEGTYRWKLLHREERPTLERNIIYTS